MAKKKSPKNEPVTEAEIHHAVKKAKDKATDTAWAIFTTVLFDKHGFTKDDFRPVWDETLRISKDVDCGSIDIEAIFSDLKKCGINFEMKPFEIHPRPTQADLNRAKRWAGYVAQSATWALMLTALKNVENPGKELMAKFYSEMLYLNDSIERGLIRPKHLRNVLLEESKVMLV